MKTRSNKNHHKLLLFLLIILIGFIGITAILSGPLLIIDPSGKRIRFQEGVLAGTPFPDFLIPGIVLTFVIGLYPLFIAVFEKVESALCRSN